MHVLYWLCPLGPLLVFASESGPGPHATPPAVPAECATLLSGYESVKVRAQERSEIFLGDLPLAASRNQDLAEDWSTIVTIEAMANGDPNEQAVAKRELNRYLARRGNIFSAQTDARDRRELLRVFSRKIVELSTRMALVPDLPEPPTSPPLAEAGDNDGSGDKDGKNSGASPTPRPGKRANPYPNQSRGQSEKDQAPDPKDTEATQGPNENQNSGEVDHGPGENNVQTQDRDLQEPPSSAANAEAPHDAQSESLPDHRSPLRSGASQDHSPNESSSSENKNGNENQDENASSARQNATREHSESPADGSESHTGQSEFPWEPPGSAGSAEPTESAESAESPGATESAESAESTASSTPTSGSNSRRGRSGRHRGSGNPRRPQQGLRNLHHQQDLGESRPHQRDLAASGAEDAVDKSTQPQPLEADPEAQMTGSSSAQHADGQGQRRTGYTPFEDGLPLWNALAELFGVRERNLDRAAWKHPSDWNFTEKRAAELDQGGQPWESFTQDMNSPRPRRVRRRSDWFNSPGAATRFRTSYADKLNEIALNYLTKALPVAALREAYQHPQRAMDILRGLSNLIAEALSRKERTYVISDELNLLKKEVDDLINDLVFLAPDASNLLSISTTIGALSPTLSAGRQNNLRAIARLLAAIESRSQLTDEERNLMAALRELEQEAGKSSTSALSDDPEAVGKLLWDLLPGPLSRILIEQRYFAKQALDASVFARIGNDFLNTNKLDFFAVMIKLMPWVRVNLKERDQAKISPFPVERKGAEDTDEWMFLTADDISLWPRVVESPYPLRLLPPLIEQNELLAHQPAQQRDKVSPQRPRKKRSTVALVDVSGSMGNQGLNRFVSRNVIVALYLEFAFMPVAYHQDEFTFILIYFDATAHEPIVVKTLDRALKLLEEIEVKPPGAGNDTKFFYAFERAFDEIRKSRESVDNEFLLDESSNILLVTDGKDSTFRVKSIQEMKEEKLGADYPLQVDVFSLEEANSEFENLHKLRSQEDAENGPPLTYLHLKASDLARHLGHGLNIERSLDTYTWTGLNSEKKTEFLAEANRRARTALTLQLSHRARLGRYLLAVAGTRAQGGYTLLDAPPPRWQNYLAEVKAPHLAQLFEQNFGYVARALETWLSGANHNQVLEKLYDDLKALNPP
ncbi:MAG: hypothetical protein AB7G93_22355 [Bdellovibrionales bacterium]